MAYTGNGPRAGRTTGRNRNTLMNNASKKLPVVPPSAASAFSGQLATAQYTLAERLAALRAGKGLIQGQFQMDRAAAKSGLIEGMAGAVNTALDTGMLGSSVDAQNRVGVVAAKEAAMQQAMQTKLQGLLGLRADRIGAWNDYHMSVFQTQADKAALQAEMAADALMRDLVARMGDEQGPAVPGGAGGGTTSSANATSYASMAGTAAREGGAGPGANATSYASMAGTAAREGGAGPGANVPPQVRAAMQAIGPILSFLPDAVRKSIIAQLRSKLSMGVL